MTHLLNPEGFVPFGYKQHWLAVRGKDPSAVADALCLYDVRAVTFSEGIARLDGRGPDVARSVFVTPTIAHWTLVVAGTHGIPAAWNPSWIPFLDRLSARLGHVQYFGTHRVVGYVAWARSENGNLVRAYAYSGESDKTLANLGEPTPEEKVLGIDFLDERSASEDEFEAHERRVNDLRRAIDQFMLDRDPDSLRDLDAISESDKLILDCLISRYDMTVPNESSVMLVAGRWSIDPTRLEGGVAGLGLLGRL
jgi:hypothetical protein